MDNIGRDMALAAIIFIWIASMIALFIGFLVGRFT